jgi:hypothetical protein
MIKIETNSSWLKVCNIQKPSTGLEAKFSYTLTTSMILNGINMSKPNSYNQKVCTDTVITEIRDKVIVIGNNNIPKSKTIVTIHHNNEKITKSFDLSDSINPDVLYKKIIQKSETLIGKRRLDKIVSLIEKPKINKTKSLIKILSS